MRSVTRTLSEETISVLMNALDDHRKAWERGGPIPPLREAEIRQAEDEVMGRR